MFRTPREPAYLDALARDAVHDEEADGGIPEADDEPWRRHAEQREQEEIDPIEAASRQSEAGKDEKRRDGCRRQGREDETANEHRRVDMRLGAR